MKKVKSFAKTTREALKAQTATVFGKKNALELVLTEAERNKNNIQITEGDYIIDIHRADEEPLVKAVGAEIDINNIVSYDRMIQNLENQQDSED